MKHLDFIIIDILCFQLSFIAAYLIQFRMLRNPYASRVWANIGVVMTVLNLVAVIFGNYLQNILRRGYLLEFVELVKQTVVLELLTTFYLYLIHEGGSYSRTVVFLSGILFCLLTFGARTVWKRYLLKRLKRRRRRFALVGEGALLERLRHEIVEDDLARREIVSVLNPGQDPKALEALEDLLARNRLDDVVIVQDNDEKLFNEVVFLCEKYGCRISAVPYFHDALSAKTCIEPIGDMKLLNFRVTPLDSLSNAMVKRCFDIVVSLVLLVLTSPIMLIAAIGTRLSSPGPILFRQERVGRYRRNFTMLKFRSMRITGTENTGWSTDDDPRKTKFGSFIRKCSIDELPQLINVLQGTMSLIGPRPEIPFHVDHFKNEIPLYLVRQQVRPGITGWAQVNGLRGDTDIAERVKYDIWYIENWSLSLDIKIVFKTVFGGMLNSEKVK